MTIIADAVNVFALAVAAKHAPTFAVAARAAELAPCRYLIDIGVDTQSSSPSQNPPSSGASVGAAASSSSPNLGTSVGGASSSSSLAPTVLETQAGYRNR